MKKSLVSFLFLLFTLVSLVAQENKYTIYSTANDNRSIDINELADACANADVVFFGEEHDDSLGHALQDTLFKLLYERRSGQVALSMEMFETDVQLVLNEYLADIIPESRLEKDARPWGNYKEHYRPMVEFAKEKGLSVIAANPPRRYVTLVGKKGLPVLNTLSKEAREFLPPPPYDTLSGRYHQKFQDIMGGHGAMMSHTVFHGQNLWDAGMSYSIAQYQRKHKKELVYHLLGRFHSDERLGTMAQLLKRRPKLKVVNISCFRSTSDDAKEPEKFRALADFVIVH